MKIYRRGEYIEPKTKSERKSFRYKQGLPAKRKVYKEYIPKLTDLRYIFPDETSGQPFCIVTVDYLAMPKPLPSVYAMAGECGYSLVGLMVAMAVHESMSIGCQTVQFLPTYYYGFLTQEEYQHTQITIFTIMTSLMGQIVEDMLISALYISQLPLSIYIGEFSSWLSAMNTHGLSALRILNNLHKSKEFTFYECRGLDPAYNSQMFRKFSIDCPDEQNFNSSGASGELEYRKEWYKDINMNLMGPQRFETYIEQCSTELRQDQTITGYKTYTDSVEYVWDQDGIGLFDVQVSFFGSQLRDYDKLIITYTNYPIETGISHSVEDSTLVARRFMFEGADQIMHYFRAVSQFILQPLATKQIWESFLIENKIKFQQDDYYLWTWADNRPKPISTNEKQKTYKDWCHGINYAAGSGSLSGVFSILLKKSVRQNLMTGLPV